MYAIQELEYAHVHIHKYAHVGATGICTVNECRKETIISRAYIKNCDPFVLGPLFAIESRNGCWCFSWNCSSE